MRRAEVLVPHRELRWGGVGVGRWGWGVGVGGNPGVSLLISCACSAPLLSPPPTRLFFIPVSLFLFCLLALFFSSAYIITYSIYLSLSDISPSIISWRSIADVTNGKISFFLWLSYSTGSVYYIFLIHLLADWHLCWLHIAAIISNGLKKNNNKAAVNIAGHDFLN